MNQSEIREYTKRFLEAHECEIIEENSGYLQASLSVQADKEIANRHFYWTFVERTGAAPQTSTLTLIFDPEQTDEKVQGEVLHFGGHRLHQMFRSAQKHGRFIRLYEQVDFPHHSTRGLTPWLLLNYKISFISDQKKDMFYPLGFNLITGQIQDHFDQHLDSISLTPRIPDYLFTIRPIFSLKSAVQHIEQHIRKELQTYDQHWAEEANKRLDEEVKLIQAFFSGTEEEQSMLSKRMDEVESYRPRIEVNPINAGLIYLQKVNA